jgi:hypothetical protein
MKAPSKLISGLLCTAALALAASQVSAQVLNGGFETAGANATLAANWTTDTAAGGPVYGIRTNDNPFAGSFNYEIHLASTGAGPVVQFNQSGVPVTGGAVYTFSFESDRLAGSQGDSDQWRILWNAGGDTGYQTYTPGNNAYALFSTSVTAPATATSATIFFHFAGPAIPAQSATIDVDNVSLVPEPTTVSLVVLGLFGAVVGVRRRKS